MMKAMLMSAPGAPEVLQVAEVPDPVITNPRHVLVRLKAAGVNPIDTKLRQNPAYYPDRLPAILGCDGAGAVEAVGTEVTRFKAGDEVYFFNGGIGADQGNYAQYTTLHEDYCAKKPANLSMAEAAALPLALITAWESLYDRAGLEAGQTVLIHAAAGGVGHLAVQLARNTGARAAVTVSNSEKGAFARSLGAEQVIDYTREDFVRAVLDWTGNQGVDVVLDPVGGDTHCRSFGATKVYGKIVTLVQPACPPEQVKVARMRSLALIFELMLGPSYFGMHEARCAQRRILEAGAQLAESGKLAVTTSFVLPLDQAAEAHRLIEAGHTTGKIVLHID